MDNKKIGKLIADLRRKQGLTQQDLGDKVGVGFRAVSKWERGLTLPDISIINELSKILGISSDELLTGTINKENKSKEKRKLSKKIKITITIITSIIIMLTSIFIYYNNKTYTYNIYSANQDDYFVEGQVSFYKNEISIIVSGIKFKKAELKSLKIKNYEYDILLDNEPIFRYGYDEIISNADSEISIQEFTKIFNINYIDVIGYRIKYKNEISLSLIIRFIDQNDNEITKKIDLILAKTK